MVQILEPEQNPLMSFLTGLSRGGPSALTEFLKGKRQEQQLEAESKALGIPENVRSPEGRKFYMEREGERIKKEAQKQKDEEEFKRRKEVEELKTKGRLAVEEFKAKSKPAKQELSLTDVENLDPEQMSWQEINQIAAKDKSIGQMLKDQKKFIEAENRKTEEASKKLTDDEKAARKEWQKVRKDAELDIINFNVGLKDVKWGEKLLDKTRGITGTLKGVLGNEDSSRLYSVATSLLQPILKIYNPAGPIPKSKIAYLEERFIPKFWERSATSRGKFEGLRDFYKSAMERAEQRKALANKYLNNPLEGEKELAKYDKNTEQLLDEISGWNNYSKGLGLEEQNLEAEQQPVQEVKDIPEGAPAGAKISQLTPQQLDYFLNKAGGDPKKAKELAIESGFKP